MIDFISPVALKYPSFVILPISAADPDCHGATLQQTNHLVVAEVVHFFRHVSEIYLFARPADER